MPRDEMKMICLGGEGGPAAGEGPHPCLVLHARRRPPVVPQMLTRRWVVWVNPRLSRAVSWRRPRWSQRCCFVGGLLSPFHAVVEELSCCNIRSLSPLLCSLPTVARKGAGVEQQW